jgi:hypothetical protein
MTICRAPAREGDGGRGEGAEHVDDGDRAGCFVSPFEQTLDANFHAQVLPSPRKRRRGDLDLSASAAAARHLDCGHARRLLRALGKSADGPMGAVR